MRYCLRCGAVYDEYDYRRDDNNCDTCGYILEEDNMTALEYAKLSEKEKDDYDNELLSKIKNNPVFSENLFKENFSLESGMFWFGFRFDKYAELRPKEKQHNVEYHRNLRKSNEPFKPFPPIDRERAIAHSNRSEELSKEMEQQWKQKKNVPKCPTCQSTNLHKISTSSKIINTAFFGLFGTKRHKTFHCDNCGYEW